MSLSGCSTSVEKMKSSETTDVTLAKEKELFLTQIQFLDKQLERFQFGHDELEEQNKDLVLKSSALQKDTADILEYLQHFLTALEKDEQDMKKRVEKELQADRRETEALELLLSQENQELLEKSNKLSSESNKQAAGLEDQKEQLVILEQKIQMKKSLDEQVQHLEKQHSALAKKMVVEQWEILKERKATMTGGIRLKVNAVVQEETAEHERMLMEVESLAQKSVDLLTRKSKEKNRLKVLCQTAIKMRILSYKMIHQILNLRKESVKLRKRCKLLDCHINELQSSNDNLLGYREAQRWCLVSLSQEVPQKASLAAQLEERLQVERRRTNKLERDLKRAASVLYAIATSSDRIPEAQDRMSTLLQLMDTREPQEAGTSPSDSSEQTSGEQKPQTSEEEAASRDVDVSQHPLFLMAKLRPGDLRLVPGPAWKSRALNRVKLPPIQQSLWETALHEWMG